MTTNEGTPTTAAQQLIVDDVKQLVARGDKTSWRSAARKLRDAVRADHSLLNTQAFVEIVCTDFGHFILNDAWETDSE